MTKTVVVEPIPKDWAWPDAQTSPLDNDFMEAALDRPRDADAPPVKFPE